MEEEQVRDGREEMSHEHGERVRVSGRVLSGIWCHQCKMKKSGVVVCDSYFKGRKCGRCNGKYCANCVARHYKTTIEELNQLPSWMCFKCTGECQCAPCRRERGQDVPKKKRRRRKDISERDTPMEMQEEHSVIHTPPHFDPRILKKHNVQDIEKKERISVQSLSRMEVLADAASMLTKPKPGVVVRTRNEEKSMSTSFSSLACEEEECAKCKPVIQSLRSEVLSATSEVRMLRDLVDKKRKLAFRGETESTNKLPSFSSLFGSKSFSLPGTPASLNSQRRRNYVEKSRQMMSSAPGGPFKLDEPTSFSSSLSGFSTSRELASLVEVGKEEMKDSGDSPTHSPDGPFFARKY